MEFEWDEEKNRLNIAKHKVSFNLAILVFRDEYRIDYYDYEHSTIDEDRYVTIGKVNEILYVVYTEREDRTRIISARKATPNERRIYNGDESYS